MDLNNQETVALARCPRYRSRDVRFKLEELLEPLGGVKKIVAPGQNVLLKPNLLSAAPPAEAVSTNPVIMKEMSKLVKEAGGRVFIGDSPGVDAQEKAHRICGMQEVIEETGAEELILSEPVKLEVNGYARKVLPLASELGRMDVIINMAKLKTHSLTGMTAAVKNIYGCIPGTTKARLHVEHPLPRDFSRLLIDVYCAVKPALSVIDAIIAMEGAGPRRGRPRQVGLLMASSNAVALDTVAAYLLGFRPDQVGTVAAARELGLPGADLPGIRIKGEMLEDCRVSNFDLGPAAAGGWSRLAAVFPVARIRNFVAGRRPYPQPSEELCTGCGICRENCPAQVIALENKVPEVETGGCIRCYCCLEFCPEGAFNLVRL